MLLQCKMIVLRNMITSRGFKNFGHKRQPIPPMTTLWHGFLTFTFMGMCLNWNKIGTWIFGESSKSEADWDDRDKSIAVESHEAL